MKRAVTAFLLFSSLSALAQEPFTRYQAENDHFRDYKREELTKRFGKTRKLLPKYACDGKTEFDPFFMPKINKQRDSLRIQLYKEEGLITYQKGRYFTEDGSEISDHENVFMKYIIPVLAKLEKIPETQKLLRRLEEANYPLTIAFGGNMFNPHGLNGESYKGIYMANAISVLDHGRFTDEAVQFSDIGTGGVISWNPKDNKLPGEVTLAHEMYHALDSTRGTLDMRFIMGEGYEMAFVSEYRATFFENVVRQASGVALRTHYGNDNTGPGLLDANGKPRFISAPCLK